MELTIDQALQKGIAAHKKGKVQEAESMYRSILHSHPTHPDANHNLGLLAVSINKITEGLPFFKNALDANPKVEQFWLSYIDALIKAKQFETAKQVLQKAKQQGLATAKLNSFEEKFSSITQSQNRNSTNIIEKQLKNLSEHYQNGRLNEAENLAMSITREFPKHQFAWKVLGATLGISGRNSEALNAHQMAVALSPSDAEAHNNLGVTLKKLGRIDEAEASCRQAIALKRDYAEAHYNLGNTLNELGVIDRAAESYKQAIALKHDYAEAHSNLGAALQELGRLDEAEASFRQAIALKHDYAKAHSNLGATLQELGRLDEAEASCRQAIALKSDFAEAHSLLGCLMHEKGDVDSALYCFRKAFKFDSNLRLNELRLLVLKSRLTQGRVSRDIGGQPLVLRRTVETELVDKLYEMNSRKLDNTIDARYGYGSCSPNFRLFEDTSRIIKTVSSDLIGLMSDAVKSEVYVYDSFFNILRAGGGSKPHNHAKNQDNLMDLWKQKYSLVYYVSVGDQDCSEPGVLKLYNPCHDILPSEGMIVIVPATRQHSAIYNGKRDRLMIGVNFYGL
ncbi:MAG: tetratricopeptide repeat protein [Pseudomonadota bacterium]|nr:tetratricopeptide repeat protein [Pseudomonadota bacterium]